MSPERRDAYEVVAPACLPEEAVGALKGQWMDDRHFDLLVTGGRVVTAEGSSEPQRDVVVRKPNGDLLLVYRHDYLSRDLCRLGYRVFSQVKASSRNRGIAAGPVDVEQVGSPIGQRSRFQFRPVRADGRLSRTSYTMPAPSAIIGYFDRFSRIPLCRMTAFNLDHHAEFEAARPFVVAVDRAFREAAPARYAAQHAMIQSTSPDFYIRDTVFTTITVNRNFRTAAHRDSGDYAPGFGVMSVLEGGSYTGGYLVFPKYRVAVDMRTGGVCLADVHELHGNTAIDGTPGNFRRLALVFYYRKAMRACGSAAEELERAKRRGR